MKNNEQDHSLMHDQIWNAIDRLANSFGYSPSGLAKQAGLDPTAFNKSKRISADGKPRWPSTESIARILSATGASMTDFIALMGEAESASQSTMPRYIPMIGFIQAGNDGFFDKDGYPKGENWDEVPFPAQNPTEDKGAYALEVSGDSMKPLYREGDIIVASPSTSIRRGDRVIIKKTNGEILAKELKRQTASKVDLKPFNKDDETLSILVDQISWMARILWVSQ